MKQIRVIDSHTGGEPTRIVYEGGPDLGDGPLIERRQKFRDQFDDVRKSLVNEPRGSDVLVGGLICEPVDESCSAGIIFFNNIGYLGMCGHGLIGLMVTLQHLGRIDSSDMIEGHPQRHRIETPVGVVTTLLQPDGRVTFENVPSYCYGQDVSVEVPDYGTVVGDIAWGGNWFFLVKNSTEKLVVQNATHLTQVTLAIRTALENQNITGADGDRIDHIELFGPPQNPENNSRNFVLCPGGVYDRSPCGTGTSAKLACLATAGKLQPGEVWRQESIIGSVFSCHYLWSGGNQIIPEITGSAYLIGETTLIQDPADPFAMGFG